MQIEGWGPVSTERRLGPLNTNWGRCRQIQIWARGQGPGPEKTNTHHLRVWYWYFEIISREGRKYICISILILRTLKNHWRERQKHSVVIFVFWCALITSGSMLVTWSRKSCLGPAGILCFVCMVLFKDDRRRVSSRAHLFDSDI